MPEPKRIWLSRDSNAHHHVYDWDIQPAMDLDGQWHTPDDRPRCLTIGDARSMYGVVPGPGQCVPIDLVPGEPITAEEPE